MGAAECEQYQNRGKESHTRPGIAATGRERNAAVKRTVRRISCLPPKAKIRKGVTKRQSGFVRPVAQPHSAALPESVGGAKNLRRGNPAGLSATMYMYCRGEPMAGSTSGLKTHRRTRTWWMREALKRTSGPARRRRRTNLSVRTAVPGGSKAAKPTSRNAWSQVPADTAKRRSACEPIRREQFVPALAAYLWRGNQPIWTFFI